MRRQCRRGRRQPDGQRVSYAARRAEQREAPAGNAPATARQHRGTRRVEREGADHRDVEGGGDLLGRVRSTLGEQDQHLHAERVQGRQPGVEMLNLLQGGPGNHHHDTRPLDQPRDRRPLPGAPALQAAAVGDDVAARMGQDREVLGEAVERQPHLLGRRGRHHHVEAAAQLLSVLEEGVPVGRGRDVGLALQRHREADHTPGDLETEARGQVTARRIALDDDRRGALPAARPHPGRRPRW